jgi:hypothetical protein
MGFLLESPVQLADSQVPPPVHSKGALAAFRSALDAPLRMAGPAQVAPHIGTLKGNCHVARRMLSGAHDPEKKAPAGAEALSCSLYNGK